MTFSRRAANEMIRRVERIVRAVIGQSAASVTEALSWAGTFHAIGARLLRGYADQIGLDPAFTIHDREDSADLDRALALLDELLAGAALVLQVVSRELNDAKRKLDELCTAIGETGAASEERA